MMKCRLLVILVLVLFASPLSAQELKGTLAQIKKTGQIRIGYRATEPPISFTGKDGNPTGYNIDIAKSIVTAVKNKIGADVKAEYVLVTVENRFKALVDNKIDILCDSTTKTLSRSEMVDFTQLTFVTGGSLLTLKENAIQRSGYSGKKIGVTKGTTTADALKKLIKETGTSAEIILYDSKKEGMDALLKKNIDAFSSDQVVLIGLAMEHDSIDFVIDQNAFSFEPLAFAVRRNDSDFRLVVDREIASLCKSKKIIEIYDKWIGKHIAQRLPLYNAMIQLNSTPE
jgi:ABC-type amino acid transport substrate-binding protein